MLPKKGNFYFTLYSSFIMKYEWDKVSNITKNNTLSVSKILSHFSIFTYPTKLDRVSIILITIIHRFKRRKQNKFLDSTSKSFFIQSGCAWRSLLTSHLPQSDFQIPPPPLPPPVPNRRAKITIIFFIPTITDGQRRCWSCRDSPFRGCTCESVAHFRPARLRNRTVP